MSAFDRLSGSEEPRLPVWYMIADMTRVMDGEMSFSDFATKYALSASEQAEVGEYLTALGAMVTSRATTLGPIVGAELAVELARSIVNAKMMHALLRAEQGTHTEASFRAVFGLD